MKGLNTVNYVIFVLYICRYLTPFFFLTPKLDSQL